MIPVFAPGATVRTAWGGGAEKIYETGFVNKVMKRQGGGVSLFNMVLIENDAPGSGYSEKGEDGDVCLGKDRARKILYLDDPRAEKLGLWRCSSGRPGSCRPIKKPKSAP